MSDLLPCALCGRPKSSRNRCYPCTSKPKTGEQRVCEICSLKFYVPRAQLSDPRFKGGRFCSILCKAEQQKRTLLLAKDRPSYVNRQGYVMVPVASGREHANYRAEHRVIIETAIGRFLRKDEHVHHLNGIKTDNRLDNLLLLTPTEHQKLHAATDHVQAQPRRVTVLCERCGAEFSRKASRAKIQRFCSRSCRTLAMWQSKRAQKE